MPPTRKKIELTGKNKGYKNRLNSACYNYIFSFGYLTRNTKRCEIGGIYEVCPNFRMKYRKMIQKE